MPFELALHSIAMAAAKAAAAEAAKKGMDALVEWVIATAEKKVRLSTADKDRIEMLLNQQNSLANIALANLMFTDRRGILFVGPSGAGKTKLITKLTGRHYAKLATTRVDKYTTRFGPVIAAARDTPGQKSHYGQTYASVAHYKPRVLVIVLANGYLDTRGTGTALDLATPRKSFGDDFQSFRRAALDREREWLDVFHEWAPTPRTRVANVVAVVNKMDLWYSKSPSVLKRYRAYDTLRDIVRKLARPGQHCLFTSVAADYDSFKDRVPPDAGFNKEAQEVSVILFRAYLTGLLLAARE
jgi:hypothetical protein